MNELFFHAATIAKIAPTPQPDIYQNADFFIDRKFQAS